jgi:hypothetical protein
MLIPRARVLVQVDIAFYGEVVGAPFNNENSLNVVWRTETDGNSAAVLSLLRYDDLPFEDIPEQLVAGISGVGDFLGNAKSVPS